MLFSLFTKFLCNWFNQLNKIQIKLVPAFLLTDFNKLAMESYDQPIRNCSIHIFEYLIVLDMWLKDVALFNA